jgi:lipooligosaccharide transport system permease protein
MIEALWGVRCVVGRYFDVFLRGVWYYLVTTFLEPILYLLSFGLGVGSLVGSLTVGGHEVSYRAFIFSGVIAQTVLFQGFMEASYGAFVRMYYQKVYQAIALTPVTMSEVLWGELCWDTARSTTAALVVALIGVATGDFAPICLVTLIPLCAASSLLFAGMGLAAAALARSIEQLSYPQYLLVFPMFLFCGVFYPIDALPAPLRAVAWVLPLTSVTSLARWLTLDLPLEPQAFPILCAWLIALVLFARHAMLRRLIK